MFCSSCGDSITGLNGSGLCCDICGYSIHDKCIKNMKNECKPCVLFETVQERDEYIDRHCPGLEYPPAGVRDFPLSHHWLLGNQSTVHDVCVVCSSPTGSLFSLTGLHCTCCHLFCHEDCLYQLDEPAYGHLKSCTLGPLARLMIPPHSLIPLDGRSIAQARLIIATEYTHKGLNGQSIKPLFDVQLPLWCSPLLVLVNRKSGGNRGVQLMHEFVEQLNPLQVWDLSEHSPDVPLRQFEHVPRLRILCCGGDGTVAWVLSALDKCQMNAPVAVQPLGTGNDLAQVLGWGGGVPGDAQSYVLSQVMDAGVAVQDRWTVTAIPDDEDHDEQCKVETNSSFLSTIQRVFPIFLPQPVHNSPPRTCVMNNYIGIGLDAVIAHQFHGMRSSHPHLFQSQVGNKAWYTRIGTQQYFAPTLKGGLRARGVELYVDGKKIDISAFQGFCVLNIKSFSGGSNFWGQSSEDFVASARQDSRAPFVPPRMDDQIVEVVGFYDPLQMVLIQQGRILPERLAQGRSIEVRTRDPQPVQVDGEPWGCWHNTTIKIDFNSSALMLTPATNDGLVKHLHGAVAKTVEDVLHWATHNKIIKSSQRNALQAEFSIRYSRQVPASSFYNQQIDQE